MLEGFTVKNILSPDQCSKAVDSVHKLKEHWINRGGYFQYPFYSLGAASYMDAIGEDGTYYEWAEKYNPILKPEFDWLYKFTADFLTKELGKPVEYDERQALPGFHIFLGDELFEIPVASRHCDLQFKELNWGDTEYIMEESMSFTLYIKIPSAGTGMYIWDKDYFDYEGLSTEERNKKLNEEEYSYEKFQEGDMVVHSGFTFHQIAAMEEPDEERIKELAFKGMEFSLLKVNTYCIGKKILIYIKYLA